MLKQRAPEHIRVDAIKMGIKKAQSGCPACADGYFDLAKQHGTTEQEIQEALEQATGASGRGLSRRELIKIAVASGLALTTAGLVLPQTSGTAQAATYYWGIDSNTTICCSMPLNFYIGRMGQGITPDTTYFAFNTSMASKVGLLNTFGYWGLQGPASGPDQGYSDPNSWGAAQAHAAWNAWSGTSWTSFTDGYGQAASWVWTAKDSNGNATAWARFSDYQETVACAVAVYVPSGDATATLVFGVQMSNNAWAYRTVYEANIDGWALLYKWGELSSPPELINAGNNNGYYGTSSQQMGIAQMAFIC